MFLWYDEAKKSKNMILFAPSLFMFKSETCGRFVSRRRPHERRSVWFLWSRFLGGAVEHVAQAGSLEQVGPAGGSLFYQSSPSQREYFAPAGPDQVLTLRRNGIDNAV